MPYSSSVNVTITTPARVVVDPNGTVEGDLSWSVALLEDADRLPEAGEVVLAVQPEEGEPDYVSSAVVRHVDHEKGLIYLSVDWAGFREEPSPLRAAFQSRRPQGTRMSWTASAFGSQLPKMYRPRNGNSVSGGVMVA